MYSYNTEEKRGRCMSNIKVDFSNAGIPTSEILKYSEKVIKIHEELQANKNDEKETFLLCRCLFFCVQWGCKPRFGRCC